jgi:hypothetical protein
VGSGAERTELKVIMRLPRHVLALLLIGVVGVVVAWMVVTALGYSRTARTMPLVVGVPTLVLIVLQFTRDVVRVARGDTTVGATSDAERDRYLDAATAAAPAATTREREDRSTSLPVAMLWVGCLALLIWLVGMLVAIPAFMAAFMRIFGRERWVTIGAFAVVTTVAVYLFFVVVLEVRLYPGLLGDTLPWP